MQMDLLVKHIFCTHTNPMSFMKHFSYPVLYLVLGMIALTSCEEKPNLDSYHHQITDWQNARNGSMRDSSSWLSLVALHWLQEGESTFGADSGNTILFPTSAPDFAGSFTLKDSTVSIRVAEGVRVLHKGQAITEMVLKSDMDEETAYLQMGHINFYIIQRPEGLAVRVKDSQNPDLLAFEDIPNFPISAAWQLEARLDWYESPQPIQIPTVLGSERTQYCPAKLIFEADGATFELSPYNSFYGDPVWTIIFSDLTNGETTYGGGRFLEITAPEVGTESIILDFNKAYNPPCAFSPFATCPLSPPENRLALAVPAGEQMYGEMH